jgi:hypothetical protein
MEPRGEVDAASEPGSFLVPELDDPTTPGANSPCYSTDGLSTWELSRTYWYIATAGSAPLFMDFHNGFDIGMAVYARHGFEHPTPADRLACYEGGGSYSFVVPEQESYLFQVGEVSSGSPQFDQNWDLRFALPAGNDDPETAIDLLPDTPVEVSTFGATVEPSELSGDCDLHTGWGRSVWLKTTVAAPGNIHINAQPTALVPSNASVALYDATGSTALKCVTAEWSGLPTATQLNHLVEPGTYLVRIGNSALASSKDSWQGWWLVTAHVTPVDGDHDGYYRPADCQDANPAIHPGVVDQPEDGVDEDCSGSDAVNFDRDADGYQRPSDCNDRDPRIHPGGREIPDDGIDQNCDRHDNHRDSDHDGVPDLKDRCPHRTSGGIDGDGNGCRDPIQLDLTANLHGYVDGDALVIEGIDVRAAPGARVSVACSAHACKRKEKQLRRASIVTWEGIFVARVPAGTVITVAATKPRAIGVVKRYRLTAKGKRLVNVWCTPVGRPHKQISCA